MYTVYIYHFAAAFLSDAYQQVSGDNNADEIKTTSDKENMKMEMLNLETLEKVAAAGLVSFDDPTPDKEEPKQETNALQDSGF